MNAKSPHSRRNDTDALDDTDALLPVTESAEVVTLHMPKAGQNGPAASQQNQSDKRVGRLASRDSLRRSAFTLRLDGDRHLKLRLASALTNRSAQQIVTEALDAYLAALPEIAELADQIAGTSQSTQVCSKQGDTL